MINTNSGRQILLTVAMGKRLLGDALAADATILEAAKHHCLVVILGSTNAQVAAAIATALSLPFSPKGFHRGLQRGKERCEHPAPLQTADFIVKEGQRLEGKTIFDVVDALGSDDIILKGANAIHLESRTAGILIGSPVGGTILPIMGAVSGRRTRLLHPVGLEKRVERPISELARLANQPGKKGLRLLESCGEIYTELDAIQDLFSLRAALLAAGGVLGAEGSVLLELTGSEEKLNAAERYFQSIQDTPSFSL
mgnify:FL=1